MDDSLLKTPASNGSNMVTHSNSAATCWKTAVDRVFALLPPDFPRGKCNEDFCLVLLMGTFVIFAGVITSPFILFEYTKFFNGGAPCVTKAETDSPGCVAAMEQYADVNKYVMAVQAALGFLLFAVVGRISDSVGRRAAFIGGLAPLLLQQGSLLAYVVGAASLWPYLLLQAVPNVVYVLVFSYIADIMPPKWRATFFAWFIAAFGTVSFFANAVCEIAVDGIALAATLAFLSMLLAFAVALFMLRESLPVESRKPPLDWTSAAAMLPVLNSIAQIKILSRTKIFRRVATTLLIATLASKGTASILPLYLRQVIHFTADNLEIQGMIAGVAILVTQLGFTPILIVWLGERNTLLGGLVVSLCFVVGYATQLVCSVPTVYTATVVQDISYVIFPAINSLKSKLSSKDEQGQVLGAVNAVQSLGTGLGPLIFNWVFEISLEHNPAMVWWVGVFFTGMSVLLAAFVPDPRKTHHTEQNVVSLGQKQSKVNAEEDPDSAYSLDDGI